MKVICAHNRVSHIHVSTHSIGSAPGVSEQFSHKTLCGKTISGLVYDVHEGLNDATCKRCLRRLEKQIKTEKSTEDFENMYCHICAECGAEFTRHGKYAFLCDSCVRKSEEE